MYEIRTGSQSYKFFLDVPVSVPDEIAEMCNQIWNGKGKPAFRIEVDGIDPDADIAQALGVQLKFRAFTNRE